jgi:hypothetical protein
MASSQGGQGVKRVPDKCPFCDSLIMIHGGNPLRSSDGGFATYECKTAQDVRLTNHWRRVNQSDGCRRREIELLMKQRDAANKRINRLEKAGDKMHNGLMSKNRIGDMEIASEWTRAKKGKP